MKRILVELGTVASIISLCFLFEPSSIEKAIIMVIGLGCFAFLIADDYWRQRCNEKTCKSKEEIKKTMLDLIRTDGRTCMVSRDLSWVDSEVEQALIGKGENLRIFVERETELTKRLANNDVQMGYYGGTGFKPNSRFTVIRYNKNTRQVAIANTQNSIRKKHKFKHVIYETGGNDCKQDTWIDSLAMDIIELCDIVTGGGQKHG